MSTRTPLRRFTLAILAALLISPLAQAQITVETVAIGNAGNAADTNGRGAVAYNYNIGKYEVTISQWTAFLNAVGATDPYFIYSYTNGPTANVIGSNLNIAGITRTGSSGSYSYSVMTNDGFSGNRPLTYVTWFSAARFANWLHNGQPTGAQDASTTEDGAYTLNGKISGGKPLTNSGAKFWVPTVDEWYKAAYYDPSLNGGTGGYWRYATQSNAVPGNALSDSAQANQANYRSNNVYTTTGVTNTDAFTNYLTDVGFFSNSPSAYGTFDQTGNVWEWNSLSTNAASSTNQTVGLRGGGWNTTNTQIGSDTSVDFYNTTIAQNNVGFRVAAVPEPSTYALLALSAAGLGGYALRRRK